MVRRRKIKRFSISQSTRASAWSAASMKSMAIRLWRSGTGEPVTLEYLNAYAKPENRVDVNRPFRPSKITRAEAREAYPEWYERVIVRGEKHQRSGILQERFMGMIPMRFITGGCGRSYPFEAGIATFS